MSSESSAATWDRDDTSNRPRFVDPDQTFEAVHALLGRKWHLRIVFQLLENGPMGFSGLKNGVDGISSKMLSESLSTLEDRGLVDREIVNDQPVRVEYSLTAAGTALEETVDALLRWDAAHNLLADS